MNYNEKLAIADEYLNEKADVSWNDLPDINSLHNADDQEDIFAMCDARLKESGFIEDEDVEPSPNLEDIEIIESDDEDDDDVMFCDDDILI